MTKIILTQNGSDILGSDGLMYVDGRLNFNNVKHEVVKRNSRYEKNFPHKLADGFYFVNSRLEKISPCIYPI
jgi:hypothetical protein